MGSTMLTRGHFLKIGASLIGMGSIPLGMGCPADGEGCDTDPDVEIAANHGHRLEISLDEVLDGDPVSYDIRGDATHNHTVSLTAQQLDELRRGGELEVTSSVDDAHSHQITITC